MSRNTIIALSIVGVVALCCIIPAVVVGVGGLFVGKAVEQAVVESPEEAAKMGQSILPYQLPPGYREQAAFNMLGNTMVMIGPGLGQSGMVIMLGRFNPAMIDDEEQMRQQLEQSLAQQQSAEVDFEPVSTEEITIQDKPATLMILEGTDEQGNEVREAVATFKTGDSVGMLMIVGSLEVWDEEAVEAFLNSIR